MNNEATQLEAEAIARTSNRGACGFRAECSIEVADSDNQNHKKQQVGVFLTSPVKLLHSELCFQGPNNK